MSFRWTRLLLCFLCGLAVPALAVRDVPAPPDSLGSLLGTPETSFGAGTSWMVGRTLVEQGDLAGALPYLMQAWRLSPEEEELAVVTRDVLAELGYGRDALDVSRRLLEAQADLPPLARAEARERHVAILVSLARYDDALTELAGLQREHPDTLLYVGMEGEVLLRAERLDDAVAVYEDLRRRDPEGAPGLTATLAEIAQRKGDPDRARALWSEGVERWPDSVPLRLGLIRFEVSRGRDAEAFAVAASGPGAGPRDGMTWVGSAAGLIMGAGREPVARAWLLEHAQDGSLAPEDTLLLCRLLATVEDIDTALPVLGSALERAPEHPGLLVFQAEFLASSGDLEDAESAARRAYGVARDDLDVLFSMLTVLSRAHPGAYGPDPRESGDEQIRTELLGLVGAIEAVADGLPASSEKIVGSACQELGLAERAIAHYQFAAAAPEFERDALLSLSFIYEESGRNEELVAVLERLLASHPDDPVVQNALGYTLADLGLELERAEQLIRSALAADPENPAFRDSLGWLLYRKGDATGAFDHLIHAVNQLPDDPVILEHLARVLAELGQAERSRSMASRALAAGGEPAALADLLGDEGP